MFEDSLMKLGPASVLELNKGKRIKPFISNRQPQNTIEGIQFAAKRVCAAMNMPFEEVLLVFNKSYTASKAVKNSAGLTYTNYRLFIGNKFCQKVYSRFVDTLKEDIKNKFKIEAKSFRQDLALKNADWLGPRLRSIDEVKDAQAAKLRIDSELSSVPREQKELNVNWSNELRQRAAYLEKKKTLFSPFLEFLAKIKGIFTN